MFDPTRRNSAASHTLAFVGTAAMLGLLALPAIAQPTYTDLSTAYNVGPVRAVSADGTTITGEAWPPAINNDRVYRLRATGPVEYLPIFAGYPWCKAHAISANGDVIVGESNFFNVENYPRRMTRWTSTNPPENLGLVAPTDRGGFPVDVSADGSVVLINRYPQVGTAYFAYIRDAAGNFLPFMDYAHVLVSVGTALSADGTTAVGNLRLDSGPGVSYPVAFKIGQPLLYLEMPSSGTTPAPFAVNHDGVTIHGDFRGADSNQHLIRWDNGLMTYDVPINWSIRLVNDAATIFAGLYNLDPNKPATRACFTSPTRGFADLTNLLTQLGVDLNGWTLTEITGMSDDGKVMAGTATKSNVTHYWVLRNFHPDYCPADLDHDGNVDLTDFFAFFNCFDTTDPCADFDGNSVVDLDDYFAFFNAFDQSC